jgi:hypothetical protein
LKKEKSKSAIARAQQKVWAKQQKAGLALRAKMCGALGLKVSNQLDAFVGQPSSLEEMRTAITAASQEIRWLAEKFIDLAKLIESDRIELKRGQGEKKLSKREERLAIAERNVLSFRREERSRKKRSEQPPKVAVGFRSDGSPILKALSEGLMIEAQVRNWGDEGKLFKRDDLEAQLARERRSASRHKLAAKKRRLK